MTQENINWQVTSLELSKQLKSLNVPQESLFYWELLPNTPLTVKNCWELDFRKDSIYEGNWEHYSTFICSELGKLLPPGWMVQRTSNKYNPYVCRITLNNPGNGRYMQQGKTICEAMAKMLVYLLKNNLIKL